MVMRKEWGGGTLLISPMEMGLLCRQKLDNSRDFCRSVSVNREA